MAKQHASTVIIDEGDKVLKWRSVLSEKYSAFPGIRSYHDFIFSHNVRSHVQVRVRTLCYTGALETSRFRVTNQHTITENVIPGIELTYKKTIHFP